MRQKNWFAFLLMVVLALFGSTAFAQSQDICVSGLGGSVLVNGHCECPTVQSNGRAVHMIPMRVRLQTGNFAWGCGMPAPPRPRPRPVPGQPTPPAPQPQVINAAWVEERICTAEGILCARDAQGRADIPATGRNVTEFVTTTRTALQSDRAALTIVCRDFPSFRNATPVVQADQGATPPPAQPATQQTIEARCLAFRDQLDQLDATVTSQAGELANHEERIAELERRVRQLSGGISDFTVFVRNGSVNMTVGAEPVVIAPINAGSISFCGMATVALVAPIAGEGQHRFRVSGGVGGGVGGLGGIMCAQVTGGYQYRPINSVVGFSADIFGIGMWDPLNPQSSYGEGTNRGFAFGARIGVPFTLGDRVTLTPYIGAGYGRSMLALPQGGASATNGFMITGGLNLEIRVTR